MIHDTRTKPKREGKCAQCGAAFTDKSYNRKRKFCVWPKTCKDDWHHAKRKAETK